jgi:cardiolipin synthase
MDWASITALAAIVMAVFVTLHVLWTRDEPRGAFGWIGLAWLSPLIGAGMYVLFGINRIRRRGRAIRQARRQLREPMGQAVPPSVVLSRFPEQPTLATLARAIGTIDERPLVDGNGAFVLQNGDEAYPAMLTAIEEAEVSILLESYIFELSGPGLKFVEALAAAVKRGVDVRVLVDAAGVRYGFPPIDRVLRRRGVRAERFLPAFPPWRMPYLNLRNHRKIMVVDGRIGFTGGLNIRPHHVLDEGPEAPTRDTHFRLTGPVVTQLAQVFAEDWIFVTSETLDRETHFPEVEPSGGVLARVVADGPDEDYDKARWAMLSALASARERITVVTPYFLPDDPLLAALAVAAKRGLEVDLVLPAKGNLRIVNWAMEHVLDNAHLKGVRIWRSVAPFDHSKLLVIDRCWSFIGSVNWDARSLRLNFEMNVEIYDAALAEALERMAAERIESATPWQRPERSPLVRLRNALAGLFRLYL